MSSLTLIDKPWYTVITLDILLKVLDNSIFHPFIAWLVPLCLRATAVPYSDHAFIYTVAYAIFISILRLLSPINQRIAFGPPRDVDLNEEVIVITGGASGLGRCVAEIYALKSASVVVLDIKDVQHADIVEGVDYYFCDVGDKDSVKKTWAKIELEIGTPTILINNAAQMHGKKFQDMNIEEVDRTFRTNALSHFHMNSLFLQSLQSIPSGGTIVTVSSILGRLGASYLSAYTASKAALRAFHYSLTAELGNTNPKIKTILVTSGQLSTDMFSNVELGPVARFFGPIVEVKDLAIKIVNMIDEGKGGLISEPAYTRWIVILDLMPVGLQKTVRLWAGIDTAMTTQRARVTQEEKERGDRREIQNAKA
ncbi:hypothetical protein MMC06_003903 [Schaereria dolodes]|nr:hypothetical protein [Schaereria dolodes]